MCLLYSPILALLFAPSSSFMSDDEFAISVVFVPTPSHILFLPAPDPPDSTTGVGKSKFSPNASATIVGGTGPFTYLWNNGETTSTASSLCAGTISVDITDANGCVVTVSDLITEPIVLNGSIVGTDLLCNSTCDGSANLTISG